MYIAIAGNIGCGKTSLTKILSERTGAKAYFEESDNPYIGDFYDDMNRWSFNLQIYFLGQRIRQAKEILATGSDLIQDRSDLRRRVYFRRQPARKRADDHAGLQYLPENL